MAWERLSEIVRADDSFIWAYCRREIECGHNAKLDLPSIIERFGDMGVDELRDRLKCSACGARVRIVMTHTGRPQR